MKINNFQYNGFSVDILKGEAAYTAAPIRWTTDPGIVECLCSDGLNRLIPTCCFVNFKDFDWKAFGEQPKLKHRNLGLIHLGEPSHS
jgi:hypothetical protein